MNFESVPAADLHKEVLPAVAVDRISADENGGSAADAEALQSKPQTFTEARDTFTLSSEKMSDREILAAAKGLDTAWTNEEGNRNEAAEKREQKVVLVENMDEQVDMARHGEMPGAAQESLLVVMRDAGVPQEALDEARDRGSVQGTIDSIREWFGNTKVGKGVTALAFSLSLFGGSVKDAEAGVGKFFKEILTQSAYDTAEVYRQRGQAEEQRRQDEINYRINKAREQAEQHESKSEQDKADYIERSTAELREFFGNSARIKEEFNEQKKGIEAEYRQKKDQLSQGEYKDEVQRREARRDADVAYHQDISDAAGIAWNKLHEAQGWAQAFLKQAAEEKYTFIGKTGITDHSEVNAAFIKDFEANNRGAMKQSQSNEETLRYYERLDAKAVAALEKLGESTVSRIVVNTGNAAERGEVVRPVRGARQEGAQPNRMRQQQNMTRSEGSGPDYSGLDAGSQVAKKPTAPDYQSGSRGSANDVDQKYRFF